MHLALKSDKRLNCKSMALVLNALYLNMGLKSRYILCLPIENSCDNAHFMVEVFCKELCRWILIDSSYGLFFLKNEKYISMKELRIEISNNDKGIKVKKVLQYKKFSVQLYFKALIPKLYRFIRPQISSATFWEENKIVQLVPNLDSQYDFPNSITIDSPKEMWK